ncbi:MAG: NADH-quinone oxidoreductase subunit N [Planctomycetota bacterium]|jgi:NADH-quinone oxidoreductase subunit N
MGDKLWFLLPEIWLFVGAVVVSVLGLSRSKLLRDALPLIVCAFLAVALVAIPLIYTRTEMLARAGMLMPMVGYYVKMVVCAVGIVLAMLSVGLVDRRLEDAVKSGRARFDPIRVSRGEYFAFFLLSLIGTMLVCNANDLIWLFLALELTSLPTKYFFLGALAAAMFLYGFALLYGSTGTIVLTEMREALADQAAAGGLSRMAIVGMILAVVGVSYKIVAVPMHFYAADVYEGAAAPVTAFLGFVPKAAGTVAIILLLGTVGWSGHLPGGVEGLPQPILITLWMIAVLTMTLGNVGALLQRSAKRLLAYSSIAHSGYLLIGVIAGPGLGINSVLFYLLVYGVMNTGAFAAITALERRGEEVEALEDLAGLRLRHPMMSAVIAIAAMSLIGFPPLLGFWGKLMLLVAGVRAGHLPLVVIAVLNSAISAWYYLRLVGLPVLAMPGPQAETIEKRPTVWPRVAAVLTALAVLLVPFFVEPLLPDRDMTAGTVERPPIPDLTLGAPNEEP